MALTAAIRFMHFSDVHFGVENYGKFDPLSGLNTRLIDFRKSLNFAIDSAIENGIEFALFTGDAYKSRDPSQTHQREFASCLRRLAAAGIPVALLTGNHDISNARGKANSVEIFGALASDTIYVLDKPGVTIIPTSLGNQVQIAAVPYLTKSNVLANDALSGDGVQSTVNAVAKRYETAIEHVAALSAQNPQIPTIFAGHFSVASAKIGVLQKSYLLNEPEVSKGSLIRDEFDYVALGHIHKYQDLNAGNQPPVVYSGSIDRIDFGERSEAKGYVLVDLTKHSTTYKFIESPSRPFLEIDIDTTRGGNPTDKILDTLAKEALEEAVVKLVYHVRSEDEHLIDDRRIHEALAQAFIKIAVRKEVADQPTQPRGIATAENTDPLHILQEFIGRHASLSKNKDLLYERAKGLVEELLREDAA